MMPFNLAHIPVHRSIDPTLINGIINMPEVRPMVAEIETGPLDISGQLANRHNFLVQGEAGGILFLMLIPGIYEAHTVVHPEARGRWTQRMIAAAVHWMYTRTDCVEITTRVPQGHLAALTAATSAGLRREFDMLDGCVFRGKPATVHVLSYRLQDWLPNAPELAERGAWFHARLAEEALRLDIKEPMHPPDDVHNRYVGACVEMAFGGQILKGVTIYNRWARMARHATVLLVGERLVQFDIGILDFGADDVKVIPCN